MSIDYGNGKTNIDHTTGIRFGVISQHDVGQSWYNESEAFYDSPHCPKCGDELNEAELEDCDNHCDCGTMFNSDSVWGDEAISHYIDNGEYSAECGDSGDIFITKSPYYTNCGFCSPCAPGAGYLTDDGDDCKAYCFGPDWFNDSPPHDIYRVEDDSLVFKGNNDDHS